MLRSLLAHLPAEQKARLKTFAQTNSLRTLYRAQKGRFVRRFLAYGSAELERCLHRLGIRSGDSVMLHSAFDPLSGFRGSPKDVIDTFLGVLGPSGHLLMVSLPYRTSTSEYLKTGKVFDVRRTPSQMGLISEVFRRREGVRRSLHPTHSVLAHGPRAEWIVAQHETCIEPCGPGSPFEKLAQLGGKVVFYNVPFTTNTFLGYLEHLVAPSMGFPLYVDQIFDVPVVDSNGARTIVRTHVFSPETVHRRRPMILHDELQRRCQVRRARVGNTRLIAIDTKDAVVCTQEMARAGRLFYASGRSDRMARQLS